MGGVFSDWRKTALGAAALLIFALVFSGSGGVGETAVDNAHDLAERQADEIRAGEEAHRTTWFAPDESTYEVRAEPPPPRPRDESPPMPDNVTHNPEPVGADFPAGLKPPA